MQNKEKDATVIAVANQKGGVGKTSTATALASGLEREGYKTLLVDADPQGNSTDTSQAAVNDTETLYDLMAGACTAINALQHTVAGDSIACNPLLRRADNEFKNAGREYLLREGVEPIFSKYDYVIIDTAPNLGILLVNALTAASEVIIPIVADRYSLQGLDQLKSTIQSEKKYTNRQLRILGLLITMYQSNTRLTREVVDLMPEIESVFDTRTFKSKIRFTTKVKEASAARNPLFQYDPY